MWIASHQTNLLKKYIIMKSFIFHFLLLSILLFHVDSQADIIVLRPNIVQRQEIEFQPSQKHRSQSIDFNYQLKNLLPSTSYEVRVSYPAIPPLNIAMQFRDQQFNSRKLLNTEKLMFKTLENGEIDVNISVL
jgi:hypothetical protein